ncbi:LysR family transcriptional regulator [Rubellimicrobium rubrum]|uniref:LysR family transcriptional regulator n=1 Tax=Rubellimicrobium rubrum TaxID=2585369 RepID=A0A5C4MQ01_9RHOB|nr:LysR family transcriptional regulator [Rubellimicrobium rubrum]TNC46490.1 LysR family transcriptional regulator [Rubellimicrobium rubrum]
MDWDDARYFLAVAREGQMLGAARRLGVSQALLSRRMASFERAVGARLLDRGTRGCTVTEDGRAMLESAERVEAEMLAGIAQVQGREDEVCGTVRIGAPDGFGSAFLAPRLQRLITAYPSLRVQLVPVPRSFSLSQREADVAVMVGRPEKGRLRVRRLTDYGLSLYAATGYLDQAGRPTTLADLRDHVLVGYVEDLIYTPELNYSGEMLRDWRSTIEVSTAIGQFEAVRSGAGIGILHDFMAAGQPDLVRLFPERTLTRTYWTVWHEAMRVERRVQVVVDFMDRLVRDDRPLFRRE